MSAFKMILQLSLVVTLVQFASTAPTGADAVVPEGSAFDHQAAFSSLSAASFIAFVKDGGGDEAKCKEFADETIKGIEESNEEEQRILDIIPTGELCAAKGQIAVRSRKADQRTAENFLRTADEAVKETQKTKKESCSVTVTFTEGLGNLMGQTPECLSYTNDDAYNAAKSTCLKHTGTWVKAKSDRTLAKEAVDDAVKAVEEAIKMAARLKKECHCEVKEEQETAWNAASDATSAHEKDWKRAHEIDCALLHKGITAEACPKATDCPKVTKPTVVKGVEEEVCEVPGEVGGSGSLPTKAPTKAPTRHPWAGQCCHFGIGSGSTCHHCPRGHHADTSCNRPWKIVGRCNN